MAETAKRAEKKSIKQITDCSICNNGFTDPRVLPCIHTFCFECIRHTVETAEKKPGDKMPCPLCSKEFTIPEEGIIGLPNNFFVESLMENLLELNTTIERNEPISKLGSEGEEASRRLADVKYCIKHIHKPLDYYCADCKKIVCVSCFVENHKLHDCKDVTTVEGTFRETIGKKALTISDFINEMMLMRQNAEKRKTDFMKEVVDNEKKIYDRSQELKDMIDRHTKSLLDELLEIKAKHLNDIENQMGEIERCSTMLSSFEAYCTELTLKGLASDICSSVDQLLGRADVLEKEYEAFIGHPHQSVEVTFIAADFGEVFQKFNKNFVGHIKEIKTQCENCAIVLGLSDGDTVRKDVIKINLCQPNEITTLGQIPTAMKSESFAAVYCSTIYVTGIGANCNEIWKYTEISGWKKCASLVQGRRRQSAAFINEVLYICGGFSYSIEFVVSTSTLLDSVEAYNAVADKCEEVGKLVHCVKGSGNCVPFKSSLYIFGGTDKDNKALDCVQVYNTKQNTCTLLTKPMPHSSHWMRAVLWETAVILFGWDTCFIYNIETETWKERKQFKADVCNFGLFIENERIFVTGGGTLETDKDGKDRWKYRDDVRYVLLKDIIDDKPIEWKVHARLPEPSFVYAHAKMSF